jgi:hypothetical protein
MTNVMEHGEDVIFEEISKESMSWPVIIFNGINSM